jgi:hypothetical protein
MQTITNKPTKFKNMTQINQLLSQTIVNRSKKTALILALLITVTTSFSFANSTLDSNITKTTKGVNNANAATAAGKTNSTNRRISTSFNRDFKNAQFIGSEAHREFTKLTFRLNDVILSAYYADNGRLIAVVRNILSSQLPLSLMIDLKKSYSDYWITDLFELDSEGQTCYYIALENADTKIILRSSSDNTWDIYQQTDKN